MKQFVKQGGVWIDHAAACFIEFSGEAEVMISWLESSAPSPSKRQGDKAEPRDQVGGTSRSKTERRRVELRHHFYDKVVGAMSGLDEAVILGPGLAKTELEKVLSEQTHGKTRVVAVTATEQMSEPQIVAKLREFYRPKRTDQPGSVDASGPMFPPAT